MAGIERDKEKKKLEECTLSAEHELCGIKDHIFSIDVQFYYVLVPNRIWIR